MVTQINSIPENPKSHKTSRKNPLQIELDLREKELIAAKLRVAELEAMLLFWSLREATSLVLGEFRKARV